LFGILISYFTYNYLNSLKDETTIVVANQDIDEHVFITPEMLRVIHLTKQDKQEIDPNGFSTIEEVEGGVTKTKILKDKPLDKMQDVVTGTKDQLKQMKVLDENGKINEAYFISDNNRVATVRLDSEGAVGNSLSVGNWVDVIFTSNGDSNNSFSNIIMKHIKVDSVQDLKDNINGDEAQNVSLLVSAQQAIELSFGKRNGKIDLVLDPVQGDSESTYTTNIKSFLNN